MAAIRNALGRIGFNEQAQTRIVDVQGMDTLGKFALLSDDAVALLCCKLSSPGGIIVNPEADEEGQPARIRDPVENGLFPVEIQVEKP